MGHASSSGRTPDVSSSTYLIFSTEAKPRLFNHAVQDAWFSVITDGVPEDPNCHVASQIAAETLYYYLSSIRSSFEEMQGQLDDVFQYTNYELIKVAKQDHIDSHFRASLLTTVVLDGCFFLSSVGNCEAYLMRKDSVHHLTHESVKQRVQNARRAAFPPRPDRATNVAAARAHFMGEVQPVPVRHAAFATPVSPNVKNGSSLRQLVSYLLLEPEDVIVLCSNQISALLGQSKIETIATLLPPQEAAEELAELALELQSNATFSIIVLRWNGDQDPAIIYPEQQRFLAPPP